MIHLVLGGARSGKSSFAEKRVSELESVNRLPVVYVATATAEDQEMQIRIAHHQQQRPDHWQLIEEPKRLAELVSKVEHKIVLIDCLTLWLSNWLCTESEQTWLAQKQNFLLALSNAKQSSNLHCVIVSNEVGSGIVPMGELSRQFVDHAGWLNQAVAQIADHVSLVVAGLPLTLKSCYHANQDQEIK